MPLGQFESILRSLPAGRQTVSLQGEGEPLLHPQFWTMAEQVRSAGFVPYTITNGSKIDVARSSEIFPVIGVSLDTLDAAEAERIGRRRLDQVLMNFETMLNVMGADRITVYTVDFGQNLHPLRTHLMHIGILRHVIQPLQTKTDYRRRYPRLKMVKPSMKSIAPCRYLEIPVMRYFSVDGSDFPCVFIKDASTYRSDQQLRNDMLSGMVPIACDGCREIGKGKA